MEFIYSLAEIDAATKFILDQNPPRILLFNGQMGSGKTTLIKHLCKQLGADEETSSPTFSVVNEYSATTGSIFHFDFYRIINVSEAFDIGVEEYFYSGNFCLIEWPELVTELLPEYFATIEIELLSDGNRRLSYHKTNHR